MAQVFIAHELNCKPNELERIAVRPSSTLTDIAKAHNLNGYIANVGGSANDFVFDADWPETTVDDNIVIFVNVPKGDDSDVLGFIVAIAIMWYAPTLAGAIFSTASPAAWQVAVTTIGLQAAAAALIPAPEPPRPQKVPEPSPQYSARVQTNIARLGEPVPIQFGRIPNALPDLVSPEFYEYENDDQYVSLRYCLGLGEFQVHDLFFKNTNISAIPDAQHEIVKPGETGSLLPANTYPSFEVPSGDAGTSWSASAFSAPKGVEVDRIGCDVGLLGGLVSIANNGDLNNRTVTIEWQYRPVNDTNTPTGAWAPLMTHSITAATVNPLRRTFYTNVPKGRHEVQMRVTDAPANDTKIRDKVTWAGLRGQNSDHVVLNDRTQINIKLRITEGSQKLIGNTLKNFTVDCTALNREYNGTTWQEKVASRSVPWALAAVFSNPNMGKRDIGRLWIDDLKALHDKLEALNHHFDFRFDQKMSLLEGMAFIARYARSVVIPWAGTFVVVRDEPQQAITHVFQPDNCRNFSLEIENVQPFDHVIVTYSDPVTGQPKEAEYAPSGSAKERPNRVAFLGCYSRQHALSEAQHFYLANKETVTASLETANLKKPITFGSRVVVPQRRRFARQYGVIKKRAGNTLTLSNPHGITGAASLAFDDGYNNATVLNVVSVVNDYAVTVEAIPATLDIIDAYQTQEPTAYLLQDSQVNRRIMRVKSIGGESDGWRKVSLVSEGVEEPNISGDENDNNDDPANGENLTIRNFTVNQTADGQRFILKCAVDALPDADSYICQINDGAGTWRTVYAGVEPQWSFNHAPGSLQVRVAAIGSAIGPWYTKTIQVGDSNETIPLPAPGEITGAFQSGELVMQVAQVVGAAKYRWEIYDTATMTLRHTIDTDYRFTYTRLQAIADGGPWRSITVRVYSIDAADNVSDTYIQNVFSDGQTGQLSNIQVYGTLEDVIVTYDWPNENDNEGVLIFASTVNGFTPSPSNLKVDTRGGIGSFKVTPGTTWYVRVAAYDVLGKDNLNYSAQYTATPKKIESTQISDNAILTPHLGANVVTAAKIFVSNIAAISANLGTITAGLIKSADNRFNLNLNATGTSYRMFQRNLANQLTFWLKANGDAYFKGHLHAETFTTTNAVIDRLHVKNHAITSVVGTRIRPTLALFQFSWRDVCTFSKVITSGGDSNPTIHFGAVLKHSPATFDPNTNIVTQRASYVSVRLLVNNVVEFELPGAELDNTNQFVKAEAFSYSVTLPLSGSATIKLQARRSNNTGGGAISERFISIQENLR